VVATAVRAGDGEEANNYIIGVRWGHTVYLLAPNGHALLLLC